MVGCGVGWVDGYVAESEVFDSLHEGSRQPYLSQRRLRPSPLLPPSSLSLSTAHDVPTGPNHALDLIVQGLDRVAGGVCRSQQEQADE